MFRRAAVDASAILALMEMPPVTRSSARDAMEQLHKDGSPVVMPDTADDVIEVGWRRWQSFKRRRDAAPGRRLLLILVEVGLVGQITG
jgi:hypothetical protein